MGRASCARKPRPVDEQDRNSCVTEQRGKRRAGSSGAHDDHVIAVSHPASFFAADSEGQPATCPEACTRDQRPPTRFYRDSRARLDKRSPLAAVWPGDIEPLPHWAGQGVGLVTREESAADIIESLINEAEEALKSLG